MKYAATALLLSLGSDPTIDSKRIRTVLESVGIEPENDKLEHFVERLGKNQLDDIIAAGLGKMATFGVGAPGGGGAVAGGPADTKAETADKQEVKEEKQEEEEEEDFGFGLFD